MAPPNLKGVDHCWRLGHRRWLDVLPKKQHPSFAHVPKDFEGPSLAKDGIDLLSFNKDKKALIPRQNYRSTTPDRGRTKAWPRLPNEEDVASASINGKKDHLTNSYTVTHKCHLIGYATETADVRLFLFFSLSGLLLTLVSPGLQGRSRSRTSSRDVLPMR